MLSIRCGLIITLCSLQVTKLKQQLQQQQQQRSKPSVSGGHDKESSQRSCSIGTDQVCNHQQDVHVQTSALAVEDDKRIAVQTSAGCSVLRKHSYTLQNC